MKGKGRLVLLAVVVFVIGAAGTLEAAEHLGYCYNGPVLSDLFKKDSAAEPSKPVEKYSDEYEDMSLRDIYKYGNAGYDADYDGGSYNNSDPNIEDTSMVGYDSPYVYKDQSVVENFKAFYNKNSELGCVQAMINYIAPLNNHGALSEKTIKNYVTNSKIDGDFNVLPLVMAVRTNRYIDYLTANEAQIYGIDKCSAFDVTGIGNNSIYNLIAEGTPVMVWVTKDLVAPARMSTDDSCESEIAYDTTNHKAVVLVGYYTASDNNDYVQYMDPEVGEIKEAEAGDFFNIYIACGRQAMVIAYANDSNEFVEALNFYLETDMSYMPFVFDSKDYDFVKDYEDTLLELKDLL